MYYDKELELMDALDKVIVSDEEHDAKLDEIGEKTEIMLHIAFYVEGGYILPEKNKDLDLLHEFDKAREAMLYINDLCSEYNLEHIYPDPYSISNKDIYIISHQYNLEVSDFVRI